MGYKINSEMSIAQGKLCFDKVELYETKEEGIKIITNAMKKANEEFKDNEDKE